MVQVLISPAFLVNFQKYEGFKIADFNNPNSNIDLQSFVFLKTLLYTNKADWILDMDSEQIQQYIDCCLSDIPEEEVDIALIIKTYKANVIKSNRTLYKKIFQGAYEEIKKEELPPYILMGSVSKEYCKSIQDELGVVVLSCHNMKMKINQRQVVFKELPNTNASLTVELRNTEFNTIKIEDQFFAKRYTQNLLHLATSFIENNSLCQLKVVTKDDKEGKWNLENIKNHINNNTSGSCIVDVEHNPSIMHDRLLTTNTCYITLGNSLFQNGESTYTQFPIGIYKSMFQEN